MVARCSKCDFRNLGIIWDRNMWSDFFGEKIFVEKKIRKRLVEKNWDQIFSIFDRKKNRWKSQWKFKILRFRKTFEKFSKSQNCEFSLTFSSILFDQKSKIFGPKKFSTKSFRIFFDENFFRQTFSDHIFRSQMIPRFRKSHLEQRATIIKLRTPSTKKKVFFSG